MISGKFKICWMGEHRGIGEHKQLAYQLDELIVTTRNTSYNVMCSFIARGDTNNEGIGEYNV